MAEPQRILEHSVCQKCGCRTYYRAEYRSTEPWNGRDQLTYKLYEMATHKEHRCAADD